MEGFINVLELLGIFGPLIGLGLKLNYLVDLKLLNPPVFNTFEDCECWPINELIGSLLGL